MLLPYYIASMNIEHEYYERTNEYQPFPGICLVDTFELSEGGQSGFAFMTAENAERVRRQKESPIFIIIANPPYNTAQINENDNNKNRRCAAIDKRVSETYAADSSATLLSKLNDPYVKAIRWASDRIGKEGIVAFVSNNSFLEKRAFDGMRKHLAEDFSDIFHLNLKGNARTSGEQRRREGGNVFDDAIRVGVGITFFVRRENRSLSAATVKVFEVEDYETSDVKKGLLDSFATWGDVPYVQSVISRQYDWVERGAKAEFEEYMPVARVAEDSNGIFDVLSPGINTARDTVVYDWNSGMLNTRVQQFCEDYNAEVSRYFRLRPSKLDEFLQYDRVKWSRNLKRHLTGGKELKFEPERTRRAMYRPYDERWLYFADIAVDELGKSKRFLAVQANEAENIVISLTSPGSTKTFAALALNTLPDFHLTGDSKCFPFYTYAEDGTNRLENITDWALEQFRSHYRDPSITKWDIFHYVYAVLHHPEYRQRYAANLRRELPRIPFVGATTIALSSRAQQNDSLANRSAESRDPVSAGNEHRPEGEFSRQGLTDEISGQNSSTRPMEAHANTRSFDSRNRFASESVSSAQDDKAVFWAFVKAGQRLAEVHVHYEQQPEYPLTKKEKAGEKLDYRVTKMRLSKDKTILTYNQFLTLVDIPQKTYEYRLGNRSALEWVIDQYQVSTDKRSGITNDPNREDDPQYILRLIGQVITVRLETVQIVASLPALGLPEIAAATAAE